MIWGHLLWVTFFYIFQIFYHKHNEYLVTQEYLKEKRLFVAIISIKNIQ